MPIDVSEKLVIELQRISVLLALNLTKGQSQREQIEILSRIGFQPKEIAKILDTTTNTVSVALARSRKVRRGTVKQAEESQEESEA